MPAKNSTFKSSLSTQPSKKAQRKGQSSQASNRRTSTQKPGSGGQTGTAGSTGAQSPAGTGGSSTVTQETVASGFGANLGASAISGAGTSAGAITGASTDRPLGTSTASRPPIVVPTPPPPATDYINVSTTVSSNVVQVGLNPQRPELLGVFDFPACFKNGQPTPAAQLLDVQFQFKQAGYTTVASMLEPYTEGLQAFKRSFDQIQSENDNILSIYEAILPGFQTMLEALNFSTGNSRMNKALSSFDFTQISFINSSVSLYTDVYSIVVNKSLQNFLLDICKLDKRFIMGLSNTAAYMQCCLEYKNLIRYGLIPSQYRQFTTTDGFTTVGSSYPSEYLEIVDAIYTVSSTASMTSSEVSSAKNKMSNVLGAEISQLHSIVYRNSCASRILLAKSPYDKIDSMIADLIIDYDAGDVLGQSGTRSIISSRAYARTVNGGNLYQPLETKYVSAQNAEVETGRKVIIDSLLSSAVLSAGINGSDIEAYASYVTEISTPTRSDLSSMSVNPATLPLAIFVEQDKTYLPRSIHPLLSCITQFSALITGCGLTGNSASYQDLFVLNLMSLAANDSDLLFRISRFLAARSRVKQIFSSVSDANLAQASTAKTQALNSLVAYVTGLTERGKTMSARSTSSRSFQFDFDASARYGTATSLDEFISSSLDRDDGPLSFVVTALADYNATLNYRFSTLSAYSYSSTMDNVNVDSFLCIFTYTFSYLVRTGLSIGLVGTGSARPVRPFYEKQGKTFNSYRYSKKEATFTQNACTALLQYKNNQSLTTKLTELITDPDGFRYAREFANVMQGQIDKLLAEEASMLYLAATFLGFASGVRDAKTKISDLITSLTSGNRDGSDDPIASLMISDSSMSIRRIPVPVYDLDYFVSGFSVDQLLTSIAMNKTSSKVSLDHPAFPVCKTLDANEMHNLKTYLSNLDRRLSPLSDRNRIIAVGIPAGMLTFLRDQTGQATTFSSSNEISSNNGPFRITVRLMARNQRKDSDPIVVADFLFDTRVFALGGIDFDDYTVKDFNNLADLYGGTPFYKVSGTDSVEKISPSRSNIGYLINHFNDLYCKLFLKAMIGVDLSEQNFTLDKTVTKSSPDVLKADTFSRMIDILSTRFPDIASTPSFRDAIGRTIFFNENLYRSRPIYTKMFERIFCIPINLDSLGLMSSDDVDMKDLYCVIYMDSSAPAALEPAAEITASIPTISEDALTGEIKEDAVAGFNDQSTGRLGNITSGGDTGTAQAGDVNIRAGIEAGVNVLAQVQTYVENSVLNTIVKDVAQAIISETVDRGEQMMVNPVVSVENLSVIKNEVVVSPVVATNLATQTVENLVSTDFISSQAKPTTITPPIKQSSVNPDIVAIKNVDKVSPAVQAIKNIEQINANITGTPVTNSVKNNVAANVNKEAAVRASNYKNAVTSNVQATKAEINTLSESAVKSVEVTKQIATQNNVTANKNVASKAAAAASVKPAQVSASANVATRNTAQAATQTAQVTQASNAANSVASGAAANAASSATNAASNAAASVSNVQTKNIAAAKTYTNRRK